MDNYNTPLASRRAPYAPVSALHAFLAAVRNGKTPPRVDAGYLKHRAIARGNEWAFISALKFLGIIDGQGRPTASLRKLRGGSEASIQTFAHLVRVAYAPTIRAGGLIMTESALRQWFAVNSSPSQSTNAARFFREVCSLAGISAETEDVPDPHLAPDSDFSYPTATSGRARSDALAKVPAYSEWKGTPSEYLRALEIWERLILGTANSRRSRRPA